MNIWKSSSLLGIYTLTPTHCGTGQTTGTVDLPVARDATTGFPILPATTLKGVARDYAAKDDEAASDGLDKSAVDRLFGKTLEEVTREEDQGEPVQLEAGALVFTEGRLLAFPVRSLNRPFLHVTCRLVLQTLLRDLRVQGISGFMDEAWLSVLPDQARKVVFVTDGRLTDQSLVLEDLVYQKTEVAELTGLRRVGQRLASLLPSGEAATRDWLVNGLTLIPDEDFADLMQRAVPVHARIQLNDKKKTAENLWYEESLPSDCLFAAVIGERRQRRSAVPETDGRAALVRAARGPLDELFTVRERLAHVQLGGNETVGHGLCWWTFPNPSEAFSDE